MQDPPQYAVVPVQTEPHPPQLCGSLPVFTHAPLQQARPNPHAGLQLPAPPDEEPPLVPEELPLLPDPELFPLEVLPLEPLLPVDASLPPGAVEPPHCNEGTSSAPRSAIHSGHFERAIMTTSPDGIVALATGNVEMAWTVTGIVEGIPASGAARAATRFVTGARARAALLGACARNAGALVAGDGTSGDAGMML